MTAQKHNAVGENSRAVRDKKAEKENRKKIAVDKAESRKKEKAAEREKKSRETAARKAAHKIEREKRKNERLALNKARQSEREKIRKIKAERAEKRLKKRLAFYAKIKSRLKNRKGGFDYDNFGVLPRVELIVSGDRTSIIGKLAASDISVGDVRADGGQTRFKIRKKDMRKAIAILDEMCYNYQIGATYGMGRRLTFWSSRAGLLLGAVISFAALYISYGYVWRVDITGNQKLSVAAIESALKSSGVSIGRKKSQLDCAEVVAALESLDGIADASCEIVGTTLRVRVLESKDYTVHERSVAYVSKYDATVTRIIMRSGTAAVSRGDVVGKGDILANGDVYSTTGELLYTAECDAEIYGDVSITFNADISRTALEYRRTGRYERKTVFGLFGHSIGKARSPYSSYETVAQTANYDVLIPLYVTTYTFYETKPVEVEREVSDVAEAYAKAKIDEMHFIGDFQYSYTVKESVAGLFTVHLFLSGEALISSGVDNIDVTKPQ
ncbi:MAG: sporulation protein YqfD [Clostridiales bacterium]|nr:sporulation protein YqfD [Clostridiales bacterium]